MSAILYCVYVNGLFEELRRNKSGCWVGQTFLGILGYSDDNFLLAPSRESLQVMLTICENYAASHGLKFSTDPDPKKSKTRGLAFLQRERFVKPVVLCGNALPWVSSCKHLGNTIVNTASADAGDIRSQDVKVKRASFINKNNELIQEFHFANPKTINEVNLIKNSHFCSMARFCGTYHPSGWRSWRSHGMWPQEECLTFQEKHTAILLNQ